MNRGGKAQRTLGKQGENMAAVYLAKKGFAIQEKNKRFGRGEVDIIASLGDMLVFVEVKVRTGDAFGYAESFVHPRQEALYHEAATAYTDNIGWMGTIRFDIVAIHIQPGKRVLRHIEDAF